MNYLEKVRLITAFSGGAALSGIAASIGEWHHAVLLVAVFGLALMTAIHMFYTLYWGGYRG